MENNNQFTYQYSSTQKKEVEELRKKYLPKEESKIEILNKLDSLVQRAGVIEAMSVGICGCLVFGIGLCFGLNVFTGGLWLAFIFGIIGVIVMCFAYPIYKLLKKNAKAKYAPEIIRLSEEIINNK